MRQRTIERKQSIEKINRIEILHLLFVLLDAFSSPISTIFYEVGKKNFHDLLFRNFFFFCFESGIKKNPGIGK